MLALPIDQLTRLGTVRTTVRWGDPILHRPARPITDFGDDLQTLLCDMFATNTAANGAGLAAPHIGVDLAAFVYDCVDADLHRQVGVVCNPVVELPEGRDRNLETWDEGCLSLPGGYAELARPDGPFAAARTSTATHPTHRHRTARPLLPTRDRPPPRSRLRGQALHSTLSRPLPKPTSSR